MRRRTETLGDLLLTDLLWSRMAKAASIVVVEAAFDFGLGRGVSG
ncbi:hypothetical protein [Nocardia amamiensis]